MHVLARHGRAQLGLAVAVALVMGLLLSPRGTTTDRTEREAIAATRAATTASSSATSSQAVDATSVKAAAIGRPNILLVVSDDQTNATFNRSLMPTVFSQIVDQGIRFDRQYVGSSVCCPSRAEMLTGLYETQTGVDFNSLTLQRPTIVDKLHLAGYRTAIAGKYLNSHPCGTRRPEFDLWVCQGNDGSSYSSIDPRLNVNGTWTPRHGVAPEILADYLRDFIASTPTDKPFFALYAPTTPHDPSDDPRYASMPVTPWRPPSYDEDTTAANKPTYTRTPPLDAALKTAIDTDYTKMSRSVRGLDDSVKTVLDSLGSRADNTLVVYLSDNGYLYGEHRGRYKEAAYEEAVNTPMAVRFPSTIAAGLVGTTSHALVQNVDLAPTFADLAGFPWHVTGTSLLPLLTGSASSVRTAALIEHCAGPSYPCGVPRPFYNGIGIFRPTSFSGVVEQRWKYVAYADGERELYDLDADRSELHNLAGDPSVAAQQTRLDGELSTLAGDPAPDTTLLFASTDTSPQPLAVRSIGMTYFANVRNATFVCKLDSTAAAGAWAPCPTAGYGSGPLTDGDYTFSVAAVDAHGTVDPTPDSRAFSIHGSGTPITITAPVTPTRQRSGTFAFQPAAALHDVSCQLSRNGMGAWQACDPATGFAYSNLVDGRWIFRVRGTNADGVVTSPPAEAWLQVDNAGPTAAFNTAPAKQTRDQTASFTFAFPDGNAGPVYCTLDSAAPVACANGTFATTGLTEGAHTLTVATFDALGNKSRTPYTWTVDRTPPTITATAPTGTIGPDPMVQLAANEPAKWIFRLDNGPAFDANPAALWLYGLADGPHTLRSRAMDRAGNLSVVITQTWTQQTPAPAGAVSAQALSIPPRTTIDGGPSETSFDDIATFAFHSDNPRASFECAVDSSGFAPCSSPATFDDLDVGHHTFRVRGRASGLTGPTASWSWTISRA